MTALGGRVGEQQVEAVLDPVEALDGERLRTGQPVDAGDEGVAHVAKVHPFCGAAGGGNNADSHIGVGIAGFGVALRLELCARGEKVDLREDGLTADIELQVGDPRGVGRPPVGGTEVQLFGIDPIGLAVEEGGRAIVGEAGFFARGDIEA